MSGVFFFLKKKQITQRVGRRQKPAEGRGEGKESEEGEEEKDKRGKRRLQKH